LARQQIMMGRAEDALEYARESARLDPLSFASQFILGVQWAFAGRIDEAELKLRTAAEVNPGAGLIHFVTGVLRLLQGRPAEALQEAQREVIPGARLRITAL